MSVLIPCTFVSRIVIVWGRFLCWQRSWSSCFPHISERSDSCSSDCYVSVLAFTIESWKLLFRSNRTDPMKEVHKYPHHLPFITTSQLLGLSGDILKVRTVWRFQRHRNRLTERHLGQLTWFCQPAMKIQHPIRGERARRFFHSSAHSRTAIPCESTAAHAPALGPPHDSGPHHCLLRGTVIHFLGCYPEAWYE